jgi:hypothetical protein
MDNFEKVKDEVKKKVWREPVLEMIEMKYTEYWSFDVSGEFPMNVLVEESS